jgi:hypothetical protein
MDKQTSDLSAILPDLPSEFDEAGKYAMREKARRQKPEHDAFGHMSDEWVADRVRMLVRRDLWHEAICCASRDRIMRLSLEVERLRAEVGRARELQAAATETTARMIEDNERLRAEASDLNAFIHGIGSHVSAAARMYGMKPAVEVK